MRDDVMRRRYASPTSQRYLWHLQQFRRMKRAAKRPEPEPPFLSPADLFAADENGFYLRATSDTLFADTAGTTAVTPGTTAALWLDESGNETIVQQTNAAERPEYQDDPDRLIIASGKRMQADVPAITGTMVIATDDGTAAYGVDISSGNYPVGARSGFGVRFPGNSVIGYALIDRELTAEEIEDVRQFYIARGAGDNYGNVTNFEPYWRSRDELTEFPLIDTSNGTSFQRTWRDCSSLTSFPELDVSNGENFREAWSGCSSLTSFPELDVSNGENFIQAWDGCSSLTSFPELDVSNGTSFQRTWRDCSSLTSFPELDVSNGENFIQAWDGCSSLTSFPELDVSNGETFSFAWRDCSSLTSFPELDLSSGTTFRFSWRDCSSLAEFPADMFDSVTATDFSSAFANTNLTQQSIDNILVSINAANTSNGTFDQSGGSAPSPVGEAAIDALVARGWTVSVTGGYTP